MDATSLSMLTRMVSVHKRSVPNTLSRLSYRAKLFKNVPLGWWVSRDHVGLNNTRNLAAGSHPFPRRMLHSLSTLGDSIPSLTMSSFSRLPKLSVHHRPAAVTAPQHRKPLTPAPLQSQVSLIHSYYYFTLPHNSFVLIYLFPSFLIRALPHFSHFPEQISCTLLFPYFPPPWSFFAFLSSELLQV